MQNDRITLKDLSIFSSDGSDDVFALIDATTTHAGRAALRKHIHHPPDTYTALAGIQEAIKFWASNPGLWPEVISNGTLVMLEKYFESADNASAPPSGISLVSSAFVQKILHRQQYFLTQFSITHLRDFLQGCTQLSEISAIPEVPTSLKRELDALTDALGHRLTQRVLAVTKETSYRELAQLNYHVRREMKNMISRMTDVYARLDAWHAMAASTAKNNWVFPELIPAKPICFDAAGMYHPLLHTPVPYTLSLGENHHFLLLTGANMSGKTTFMRALGVGALMAHLGMGVPATKLRISFLQGIITNMHVEDNILKGESYFFAEVQRMKQTAEKIGQDKPHLVLMDELFKGTNVHDAYECTKGVIDGLLLHKDHLMILSTHLYEVARQLEDNKEISFSYFVTQLASDDSFRFTYELKQGISNDRIGYRILQKEGVIDLLNKKQ